MLKESFSIKSVAHLHTHAADVAHVSVESMITETYEKAKKLGEEKCKAGQWYAFTIDKFYYWEE